MRAAAAISNKAERKPVKSVLIADDHEIVRVGLARIIGVEFGGYQPVCVATCDDAVEVARSGDLALAIVELSISGRGGMDLVREISSIERSPPVLVYSVHDESDFGLRAIRNGARGYVQKKSTLAELREAIRELLAGGRYVSKALAQSLASYVRGASDRPSHERLSAREFQILCRLAEGMSIKGIGAELVLSVKTVSTYRARICAKLGVRSIAEMVRYALERGLV